MRWLIDIYLPFAKRTQKELRSPWARILVSLFCLGCCGWLLWQMVTQYMALPTYDWRALAILSVLFWCALYLLYVVYMVLFASGRRVQKGLISVPYLKFLGYVLVPYGFWMLAHNRLDGALAVVAGLACLGLAQQRSQRFFSDDW